MHMDAHEYLDFEDVLIKPRRSPVNSRQEVDLIRNFKTKSGHVLSGVGVVAANMDGVGTFSMAKALAQEKMFTALHKFYTLEQWVEFAGNNAAILPYVFITIGSSETELEKLERILEAIPVLTNICVDIANGYSAHFLPHVARVREKFPNKVLMAGNVVGAEMSEALVQAGADIVKVGIGPGSVCTTRKMTGVGVPQFSAIVECAQAAHALGGLVCGDGGCACVGDIAKALAGGADFVMLGGLLAGHAESEAKIVEKEGKPYALFYGMSSYTAQEHHGGVRSYRASEGKEVYLPFRGAVAARLQEILGGLRSTCAYVGATNLEELPKRAIFIRVRRQVNPIYNHLESPHGN
ncbi:GMP reductase [Helicobacter heilmannii]|uniref:GMP reductase n=1 Tax=Helicobacter heilmannii TaxID=35817 RepID=UPI00244D8233|nr:GMP reductase [Helicobacter heilmannii]GMB94124.1 GMP reductase [Helicobacter heilmannii]